MSTSFFKSTFSGSDQTCVEVAHRTDTVLIRDSKYTGPVHEQPTVSVPASDWPAFLDLVLSLRSGKPGGAVEIALHPDGGATIVGEGAALVYNADEWDAFAKGVADGEFDRH
ncbi:hypothetical protein BJY24_003051 [Nocardia transvalensis]|uniref:DUF397 domain-containing protein n=1 Tax=Nocardia transvalensis TaxID=37333 RepID=A0A7W9PDL8_9NOCA|nr:DUF397 domain-containing protein [Nocardia transvalensis]MBB5914184.1 hypothetical protein [Nocardia transvalensis]